MAKFEYDNLSKYLRAPTKACGDARVADAVMKEVLYDGARIYADALRRAAREQGLSGIKLSQMRSTPGGWYTTLSFTGYDESGKSNSAKAAEIESGTSKVKKNPFVRNALKAANAEAQSVMDAKFEEIIGKIMEAE